MNEKPYNEHQAVPDVEAKQVKTRKLDEGVSTGWEQERQFTAEEAIAAIKEMDPKALEVVATEQLVSHEGVLVSLYVRAPGSDTGYSYMLKGNHGPRNGSAVTLLERIDYAGPDSEDVLYAKNIAEYKDGVWVKKG